jgi:ornithine cyclodeaminase/alanine dehydrogenase-like protein (mu-crystallin family)
VVVDVRAMFAHRCELPPRQVHDLAALGSEPVTSLVMPAWQRGGCDGVKVSNIAHGNAALGLPGLHSTYLLYEATTGVPLAWLDGDEIADADIVGCVTLACEPVVQGQWRRDGCQLDLIGSFAPAMREVESLAAATLIDRAASGAR